MSSEDRANKRKTLPTGVAAFHGLLISQIPCQGMRIIMTRQSCSQPNGGDMCVYNTILWKSDDRNVQIEETEILLKERGGHKGGDS